MLSDSRGTLAEQLNRRRLPEKRLPRFRPTRARTAGPNRCRRRPAAPRSDSRNGLGGFAADGREYVITTGAGQTTPAPWVNVLANPNFGTVISESGVAYTWSDNAHEFRLTPWHNDPVSDASGEAFYLRDEDSGQFWSPTPLPAGGATPYVSRHGFGYSVFEHAENGIHSELWVYVAVDDADQVLGAEGAQRIGSNRAACPRPATWNGCWAICARSRPCTLSPKSTRPAGRCSPAIRTTPSSPTALAFFDVDDLTRTFSGDRAEFIGRNGTLRQPAAMTRAGLSGKVGAALDACAAIQVNFELAAGQEHEIVFRLGVAGRRGADDASTLVHRCRGASGGADCARRGAAPLATHPRRGAGGNAGPSAQCAGEWLAGVSDPGLPAVGAQRLLPVGRRVWIPRSVAGFDGADPHRAGPAA
jgi:cyclic beta-1,2-glucan synthetase